MTKVLTSAVALMALAGAANAASVHGVQVHLLRPPKCAMETLPSYSFGTFYPYTYGTRQYPQGLATDLFNTWAALRNVSPYNALIGSAMEPSSAYYNYPNGVMNITVDIGTPDPQNVIRGYAADGSHVFSFTGADFTRHFTFHGPGKPAWAIEILPDEPVYQVEFSTRNASFEFGNVNNAQCN